MFPVDIKYEVTHFFEEGGAINIRPLNCILTFQLGLFYTSFLKSKQIHIFPAEIVKFSWARVFLLKQMVKNAVIASENVY